MPDEGHVVALDDLEHSAHSHEFVGAEHGDVPFSIILVHSAARRRTEAPSASVRRGLRGRSGPGDVPDRRPNTGHRRRATSSSARPARRTASRTPARASFASSRSTAQRVSTRSGSKARIPTWASQPKAPMKREPPRRRLRIAEAAQASGIRPGRADRRPPVVARRAAGRPAGDDDLRSRVRARVRAPGREPARGRPSSRTRDRRTAARTSARARASRARGAP